MVRIGLDLLSQSQDGIVHRTRERRVGIPPEYPQQFVAMDDEADPFAEILQQLELTMREMYFRSAASCRLGDEIDRHRTQLEHVRRRPRPPENGLDPRQELFQVERLRDVVVGTKIQPAELVGFL